MAEVVLTVVFNELEAEEVCGLLKVNEIRCMYRRSTSAMDLGGSMRGPIEVIVNDTDLERAQELIEGPADASADIGELDSEP
jgi:hypothetical protein